MAGLACAALLACASAADALTVQLPVGEAHGVRIVREHGAIVVVFTPRAARLWRRVAGKKVSVLCEHRSPPDDQGYVTEESGGTTMRAPKRGRRIRTGDLTRGMDICRVWLERRVIRRHHERRIYPRELIVAIPLTQEGAVRLDERARALSLLVLLDTASAYGASHHLDGFPQSSALVPLIPRITRPLRLSVVALSSVSDTPPEGSIGYYGDGTQHAAAVVLSAMGRRLFLSSTQTT
jgi:hypothetical protein